MSSDVKKINWKKNFVEIICANGKHFRAPQVVITVPLGIIQQNKIRFSPELSSKMKAAKALGFGDVIKILLLFKTKFWEEKRLQERVDKNLKKFFFLFSSETIPTWWTQFPFSSTLLNGWLSGPEAKKRSLKTDREIFEEAMDSLASIFETEKNILKAKLKTWKVVNWSKDEFTLGSYAYATVNADKNRNILGRAEKKTLFFAGEHFEEPIGTVEAALKSGLKVAEEILN